MCIRDSSNTGSLYDTRWLYSTDFIKIKNVTLGYRIPIKNKKIINYARVYISGENLLMWDKYEGGYSMITVHIRRLELLL